MKYFGLLIISLFLTLSVSASETESKTFLVIFKAKELKQYNTNLEKIKSQLSSAFSSRAYAGNSELALLIKIAASDYDECQLGQLLVSLDNNQQIKLENIAFRLVDLTESKRSRNAFIAAFEEKQHERKNNRTLSSL